AVLPMVLIVASIAGDAEILRQYPDFQREVKFDHSGVIIAADESDLGFGVGTSGRCDGLFQAHAPTKGLEPCGEGTSIPPLGSAFGLPAGWISKVQLAVDLALEGVFAGTDKNYGFTVEAS